MDLVNKAMFNIDKKDLKSFDVMNGVLHTPYFARGKCIDEFDKKWSDINKYFYAAIEYLKDSFLLVSYLKLEFRDYMKAKGDINGKLDKIADFLDELLSRDIEKFIRFYYMQDEKKKK